MIKWICCSCDTEFNEYPSNSICPECGNEDDFEETNDICDFDRCMFIEHNKCRHVDQESCQYLKAIQN